MKINNQRPDPVRLPISDQRILAAADRSVRFSYTDSRSGERRDCTLGATIAANTKRLAPARRAPSSSPGLFNKSRVPATAAHNSQSFDSFIHSAPGFPAKKRAIPRA
ncbi:MAG: hypothetical protein WC378_00455 [Opitutaceae bacterium]